MKKYNGIFTLALMLLPLMAVSSPNKQEKQPLVHQSKGEALKRKRDIEVLDAVFRYLVEQTQSEPLPESSTSFITSALTKKGKSPSIRLISKSTGYWALRSPDHVKASREGYDQFYTPVIFNDLKKDMHQRNQHPIELDYIARKSKIIQLHPWATPMPSESIGRVSISLPGYSQVRPSQPWAIVGLGIEKDGKTLRVTCMLSLYKGEWEVRFPTWEFLP